MSPENSIAIAIAVAVGFFIYSKQKKNKSPELSKAESKPDPDSLPLSINNLEPGVFITLKGVGEEYEDWDVEVTAKHLYQQGKDEWFELECDHEGSKLWLEVEEDDGLCVNYCHTRTSIEETSINPDLLWKLDEREAGEIDFSGSTYFYEDSDEAVFYANSDKSKKEKIYYWDFISEDSVSTLHVEKSASGEFEVLLGRVLNESDIIIYGNTI